MSEQSVSDRHGIIRASMTRYLAGERLRLLSFINDAMGREGEPELNDDECNEVALSWATGCLPFGGGAEPIPLPMADQQTRPVPRATQGGGPLDLDPW